MSVFKKVNKFKQLKSFVIWVSTVVFVWISFAYITIPTSIDNAVQVIKRIIVTDDWTQSGSIILDINSGWKILINTGIIANYNSWNTYWLSLNGSWELQYTNFSGVWVDGNNYPEAINYDSGTNILSLGVFWSWTISKYLDWVLTWTQEEKNSWDLSSDRVVINSWNTTNRNDSSDWITQNSGLALEDKYVTWMEYTQTFTGGRLTLLWNLVNISPIFLPDNGWSEVTDINFDSGTNVLTIYNWANSVTGLLDFDFTDKYLTWIWFNNWILSLYVWWLTLTRNLDGRYLLPSQDKYINNMSYDNLNNQLTVTTSMWDTYSVTLPAGSTSSSYVATTFFDLKMLVDNNQLSTWTTYIVGHYSQVPYVDYNWAGRTCLNFDWVYSWDPELLLITALSNNKIDHNVKSLQHPQDIIYYTIKPAYNCGGWSNIYWQIYYREDTKHNISARYDWKYVVMQNTYYSPSGSFTLHLTLLWPIYPLDPDDDRIPTSNIKIWRLYNYQDEISWSFWSINDNLAKPNNIIFVSDINNVTIWENSYDNIINPTPQPNIRWENITIWNNFVNNSLYNITFYNNQIGSDFANNKVFWDFYNNQIWNGFRGNILGDRSSFTNNIIWNDFSENDIRLWFSGNIVWHNFIENSITKNFTWNQVWNNFYHNTVELVLWYELYTAMFHSNIIWNNFSHNIVNKSIIANKIWSDFINNFLYANTTEQCFFEDNTVWNGFTWNTIDKSFTWNQIWNDFAYNNLLALDPATFSFYNNIIWNNFYWNIINTSFINNKLGNDFTSNIINIFYDSMWTPYHTFQKNTIEDWLSSQATQTHTWLYQDFSKQIIKNSSNIRSYIYLSWTSYTWASL